MIGSKSPLPCGERSSDSEGEGAWESTSLPQSPLTPALSPQGRGGKTAFQEALQ
jgi:hypothetical protein